MSGIWAGPAADPVFGPDAFAGRRVIVTGGASGIGRATVELFESQGVEVAVFDRNGNFISGVQKTVNLQIKDETMAKVLAAGVMTLKTNFTVPLGSYMVRLVVRDSQGQAMAAKNGVVEIP